MAEHKKEKHAKKSVFGKKMTKQEWQQLSLKRNRMAILNKDTQFIISEAYRTARTNIIFSVSGSGEDECKIIALTSANPGEGKTTSTINLAITFAQTGARVLVIDGDLRKPRIHQYLGVVKTNGLSTILSNQKTFEEVVFRNIRDGLDCLTSGSIPPNPAELLASNAMSQLLEHLKFQYDYVFIDTPPVTVVTDAAAVSPYINGMILVVRQGFTNHESIEHVISLFKIAKVKMLGFFVNDIDPASVNYGAYRSAYGKRYGYKYGYKYGYRYGYRYGYKYGDNKSGSGYGYAYGDSIDPEESVQVQAEESEKGVETL